MRIVKPKKEALKDVGKTYPHRIQFLEYKTVKDDEGIQKKEWVPIEYISDYWASRTNLHGREYFQAQQAQSKATVKFTTRYISGIKNDMRIKHGEEVFNIIYQDNIKGLNLEIEFLCELVK